ncbi:MAG TPA: SMP-30/gluconolactonase/LRE family protein [Pirellulaceae bacterium]|nr:SMP-30/gluconolactonase/LRE family protein [Pirellulaceae bacterium]
MNAPAHAEKPKTIGSIERVDPAFDKLVPKDAAIEVLADGFEWSEGPVWIKKGGYLLFSDIPHNRINKWDGKAISSFVEKSGYTGQAAFTGAEPGSNGLTLDAEGRLHMCCHGDRAIKRVAADGKVTVLADKFNGKRLNSPNDLVFKSNGDLYFTDPPYGLPKQWDDAGRELEFCGVYRLTKDGKLTALTDSLTRPNGLAFSPDEKFLYVAQSDPKAAIWKKFPVKEDGTLGKGEIFFDSTEWVGKQKGLPDGLKVDQAGNVWATGPGGVIVFSPEGKVLGKLLTGEATANVAWGDDGSTLYITADMYLCKVKTGTKGAGK